MADKMEKESIASSINSALEKSRTAVTALIVILVLAVVGFVVGITVRDKIVAGGIEKLDTISYIYSKDGDSLSDEDVAARQTAAIEQLTPLVEKSGIVGARANMLLAEIYFEKADYTASRDAWLKAAHVGNGYNVPYSTYQAAVCSENLNDVDSALKYYQSAADDAEFFLKDHALFNVGRLNEEKADFEAAKVAYEKLNAINPETQWANLAKTRLIALKIDGKIQ